MTDLPDDAVLQVIRAGAVHELLVIEGPAGPQGEPGDVHGSRRIDTGTGLTGGGDLTADRELSVDFGTGSTKVARGNRGLPAGGTTGQVPTKGSATDYDVVWASPSGAKAPEVQVFDASATWTKPAGATRHRLIYVGGGAGGGGTVSAGGGALLDLTLPTADLPATMPITIGAGGALSSPGGDTFSTLASGVEVRAGGGLTSRGGTAAIGGQTVGAGGAGATSPTTNSAGNVSGSGGGAGGSSTTQATRNSLAGGAGGNSTQTSGGSGGGGRTPAGVDGSAAARAGQPGDLTAARCGSGGFYSTSGGGPGGKYGGAGAAGGSTGVGGPGGACIISYFD